MRPLTKILNGPCYYEAAWTDSWQHRRCFHHHATLLDAAWCGMPHGATWYCFAIEDDGPRQLNKEEEDLLTAFRFGADWVASAKLYEKNVSPRPTRKIQHAPLPDFVEGPEKRKERVYRAYCELRGDAYLKLMEAFAKGTHSQTSARTTR